MQTILTKTLGQTEKKPTKVVAKTEAKRLCQSVGSASCIEEAHQRIAQDMMIEVNWKGEMIGGWIDNNQMLWTFTDDCQPRISNNPVI